MVVVLSNNAFSDAVSGIIERDYFPPSHEEYDKNTDDEKSLTEFHRTTTSVTALQLHETLEAKKRAALHKQSLLYASNPASVGIDSSVTTELRNALYFPVSTTEISPGATTNTSSDPSVRMPPPRKRKPVPLSLNRYNKNDECSLTTVPTGKTTNIRSSTLINASATRFPTTSTRSRRRRSRENRNCYTNNNVVEEHWEGSTNNGEDDDDDSYFTDLDATTVDSYSIRMELRKAVVVSRNKEQQHVPAPSPMGNELVGIDSISHPLVYQLPRESPRDLLSASVIIQQRNEDTKTRVHRHRPNSGEMLLQGGRSSNRSIKSLRSTLKESYRKSQGNIHFGLK